VGVPLVGVQVAKFADANPTATPADYANLADDLIQWGDGTASRPTAILQPGGAGSPFLVLGPCCRSVS